MLFNNREVLAMAIDKKQPISKDEKLERLRHSASHVMAEAVQSIFPNAKFGIGPAIESGFYGDFDLPRSLIPEDLPLIEDKMHEIIASDEPKKGKVVYGFHRKVQKGHIYHFGFIPKQDSNNLDVFSSIITKVGIPTPNTVHPRELSVLRLRGEKNEEMVTVSNMGNTKLENVEILFNNVLTKDEKTQVRANDVTILERTSIQWTINKEITTQSTYNNIPYFIITV